MSQDDLMSFLKKHDFNWFILMGYMREMYEPSNDLLEQ